jgi:hypothetical protein
MWQEVLVGLIVCSALVYAVARAWKTYSSVVQRKRAGCGCDCTGCTGDGEVRCHDREPTQ